ncbi:class I SAM-dependent methyltransferase [Catenovulum sp. SM1970]|uniref:class I SAM-dependent methyltransferase n=1 Tax=Marinifaba aquimaris TaxID=2741323 RepID=UPI00157307F3|nr:class I SAM-dependent methyltransferase [Marinifaba aquimaris]NTS78739.1 class I SAM-dependent methyltransferase [Marinifaba aquimaris]
MEMKKTAIALATLLATSALSLNSAWAHTHPDHNAVQATATLKAAVNSPLRSDKNKARDQYRNPEETLAFFGIKPDMSVVEISPGGGWYTEILAPYLKDQGTYYAAHFPKDAKHEYFVKNLKRFKDKLASNPAYANVQLTEFAATKDYAVAPAGTADAVLTFRNLHNWYMYDGTEGMAQAFKTFYTALKPGGILGVVDHELPEDRDQEKSKKSGYIKKSWAIKYAEQAGFELVADSEINANPKDTANHPKGVWSLPPSHRDKNPELLKVGESDRFTLKFKKPIK